MTNSNFLIQRYCGGNWPRIRGQVPFFVAGPNFFKFAIKGTLQQFGEHRFSPGFSRDIESSFADCGSSFARHCISIFLLSDGIVQALWSDQSRIPLEKRWEISIDELSKEIPTRVSLAKDVTDYLCGISGADYYRSYLSEGDVMLTPVEISG